MSAKCYLSAIEIYNESVIADLWIENSLIIRPRGDSASRQGITRNWPSSVSRMETYSRRWNFTRKRRISTPMTIKAKAPTSVCSKLLPSLLKAWMTCQERPRYSRTLGNSLLSPTWASSQRRATSSRPCFVIWLKAITSPLDLKLMNSKALIIALDLLENVSSLRVCYRRLTVWMLMTSHRSIVLNLLSNFTKLRHVLISTVSLHWTHGRRPCWSKRRTVSPRLLVMMNPTSDECVCCDNIA